MRTLTLTLTLENISMQAHRALFTPATQEDVRRVLGDVKRIISLEHDTVMGGAVPLRVEIGFDYCPPHDAFVLKNSLTGRVPYTLSNFFDVAQREAIARLYLFDVTRLVDWVPTNSWTRYLAQTFGQLVDLFQWRVDDARPMDVATMTSMANVYVQSLQLCHLNMGGNIINHSYTTVPHNSNVYSAGFLHTITLLMASLVATQHFDWPEII